MKKLLKDKYRYIFFSPHFDDVVLSSGGVIAAQEKEPVLVVTVFSDHGEGKISRYAREYLHFCGFRNSRDYFGSRKKEEKKTAAILKYDPYWLGFPEAIFRFKKRRFLPKFLYNNERQLLGEIDREDRKMLSQLKREVEKIAKQYANKNSQLYFPLGIGNHVDHQILNQIGIGIAQNNQLNKRRVFFYEDFPYLLKTDRKKLEDTLKQQGLKIKKTCLKEKFIRLKYQAILAYSSQIKPLFGTDRNFKKQFSKFHKNFYENYWHFI